MPSMFLYALLTFVSLAESLESLDNNNIKENLVEQTKSVKSIIGLYENLTKKSAEDSFLSTGYRKSLNINPLKEDKLDSSSENKPKTSEKTYIFR